MNMGGPVPVVAGKVEQKDMPIYLDGLGTVQAFNTVTVHPRVDGALVQINFLEGQDVKTGDLLAVVDPKPYQAAFDQAKAQAALDDVTLKRQADLRARNVIAAQDYDTAVANAQKSKAAAEAAQVNLDYCSIKSPIDGRTGVRLIDIGNVVHAADTNGIVVITQIHPISVVFTLPEQNLQSILNAGGASGGLKVTALDRGNTTTLDEGSLAVVDNEIDQTTGTMKLKATFPNSDLKLWPGKFVNARLILTTRKDATVIPSAVVQRGPQGTYAYVIKPDKTAEMRSIKVGQTEANVAIVEDGLKPGEDVVVDGQYKLQPGAHVQISTPQQQAQASPTSSAKPSGTPGKWKRPAKS
ncbi:MAG: rane fusion protein multidrug efflux system [Verrucomicrobiota bacterium]|jgi:multidrug efflux system membrane fusion protein